MWGRSLDKLGKSWAKTDNLGFDAGSEDQEYKIMRNAGKSNNNLIKKMWDWIWHEKAFAVFLIVTVFFLLGSIVWVYHVKVLNAPKVYSDGFGYYAYLPALVRGDFTFGFIEAEDWEHSLKLIQADGGLINKYPVGVAIMESPFFFAAHLISLFRDAVTGSVTATGYSNLYQYMVLFGGVFYWMAGTVLLYRLLTGYLGFSKKVSLLACVVITYGTNLFHYASYDACFSHVYSYFLFNLFLYYLCWYEEREAEHHNKWWHTCLFGFFAGLIFMCRNTNILFVLTYVFYGVRNWRTLKMRAVAILRPVRVVPIVLTGFVTIFPQLLYWHLATGHWFAYSYGSETFYWLAPELGNFLFSVKKGLFFWSPVLLLSLVGMIVAFRERERLYTGLMVFFLLIVYVSSAWWMWYYGGSFGQRVAVDFMSLFVVFTAVVFEWVEAQRLKRNRGYRLAAVGAYGYCGICIVWNLICMSAYWYRVLPPDGADWNTIKNIVGMVYPGRW